MGTPEGMAKTRAMRRMATCHPERLHHCKGLCQTCYSSLHAREYQRKSRRKDGQPTQKRGKDWIRKRDQRDVIPEIPPELIQQEQIWEVMVADINRGNGYGRHGHSWRQAFSDA